VGLGGYQGFGVGAAGLLETERAAAGVAVELSERQLRKLGVCVARVQAHMDVLQLWGSGGGVSRSEEGGGGAGGGGGAVGSEDSSSIGGGALCGSGGGESRSEGGGGCGVGALWCAGEEVEARVAAVLAEARNAWVWGVHRQVAARADELLLRLGLSSLAPRAGAYAHTHTHTHTHTHAPAATASASPQAAVPQKSGSFLHAPQLGSPPTSASAANTAAEGSGCRGRRRCRVGIERLALTIWQQCQEALRREEEGLESASATGRLYAVCSMPYALCSMPCALCPMLERGGPRERLRSWSVCLYAACLQCVCVCVAYSLLPLESLCLVWREEEGRSRESACAIGRLYALCSMLDARCSMRYARECMRNICSMLPLESARSTGRLYALKEAAYALCCKGMYVLFESMCLISS
jgi:hypothetical protein